MPVLIEPVIGADPKTRLPITASALQRLGSEVDTSPGGVYSVVVNVGDFQRESLAP